MIPSEYASTIDKVIEVTARRKQKWEKTSDDNKYILPLGTISIAIFSFNSFPDEEPCIGFEILDVFGDRIDGFGIGMSDTDYYKMDNLYNAARRNALKIDETIANVNERLDALIS